MTPRICLGLKLSLSKVKAVYCCVGASESRISYHSRVFLQLPEPVSLGENLGLCWLHLGKTRYGIMATVCVTASIGVTPLSNLQLAFAAFPLFICFAVVAFQQTLSKSLTVRFFYPGLHVLLTLLSCCLAFFVNPLFSSPVR
jgi:hypothetical protein